MLQLEKIFSDRMVVQRGCPIKIWGKCSGSKVEISLSGGAFSGSACAVDVINGQFVAELPPMEVQRGLTLKVKAECADGCMEFVEIHDVAVGEVWIAGGQSNMEYPVKYVTEREMLKCLGADEDVRFFDVPKISYEGQENDISYETVGFWDTYRADAIDNFSAIALMFALKLKNTLHVPVGIIGCNWGATSASSWMREDYLHEYSELEVYFEDYEEAVKDLDLEWYRQIFLEKQAWGLTPRMIELNDKLNRGELDMDEMMKKFPKLPKRQQDYMMLQVGPMDQRRPCILYETMLQKIMGYSVKGVIWYQGEADEFHPDSYALLFSQLVKCWRDGWRQQLPFFTVQLAPFGEWLGSTGKAFPKLRSQQERAAALIDDVWLASIMDVGMEKDIHPKTKKAAAERLALLALGHLYGQPVLCDAPEAADTVWEDEKITVFMKNAGDGLYCEGDGCPKGLVLMADGVPVDFTAEVCGSRVVVHTPSLEGSSHVQLDYLKKPYIKANLYNSAGLCAKPFRVVRPWDWR